MPKVLSFSVSGTCVCLKWLLESGGKIVLVGHPDVAYRLKQIGCGPFSRVAERAGSVAGSMAMQVEEAIKTIAWRGQWNLSLVRLWSRGCEAEWVFGGEGTHPSALWVFFPRGSYAGIGGPHAWHEPAHGCRKLCRFCGPRLQRGARPLCGRHSAIGIGDKDVRMGGTVSLELLTKTSYGYASPRWLLCNTSADHVTRTVRRRVCCLSSEGFYVCWRCVSDGFEAAALLHHSCFRLRLVWNGCSAECKRMLQQLWAIRRIVELLDDATAHHLEAAQGGLRHIVRDIARSDGAVVRQRSCWQVRREQRGVWRHLTLSDLATLPDVRIRMQADWCFASVEHAC